MNSAKSQIELYFNRYLSFTSNEIDSFYSALEPRRYKKHEYLLSEGQVCRHRYFLTKGLVRSYYLNPKGVEQVVQFAVEQWWFTNFESFVSNQPSTLNIQALEAVEVLCIEKGLLETHFDKNPKLERVFRIIAENTLIAIQRRNEFYMKASGEEKYEHLITQIPQLVRRVPQYMIASYLDMTPEHLSTVRKRAGAAAS